jgi:hypothetical protein
MVVIFIITFIASFFNIFYTLCWKWMKNRKRKVVDMDRKFQTYTHKEHPKKNIPATKALSDSPSKVGKSKKGEDLNWRWTPEDRHSTTESQESQRSFLS